MAARLPPAAKHQPFRDLCGSTSSPEPNDKPLACLRADCFRASGGDYGSRRVSAVVKVQGLAVGAFRARRLMREQGLMARWRRKFTHTTTSRHDLPVAENTLDGNSSHRLAMTTRATLSASEDAGHSSVRWRNRPIQLLRINAHPFSIGLNQCKPRQKRVNLLFQLIHLRCCCVDTFFKRSPPSVSTALCVSPSSFVGSGDDNIKPILL